VFFNGLLISLPLINKANAPADVVDARNNGEQAGYPVHQVQGYVFILHYLKQESQPDGQELQRGSAFADNGGINRN
jgi:hypothetical protein